MGIWSLEVAWALGIGDGDMKWGTGSLVDVAVAVALVGMEMDMGLVELAVRMDSHVGSEVQVAEGAAVEWNVQIADERL